MKLNIATNFDENLIREAARYKEAVVLFGKASDDFIGGGVDKSLLKDISFDKVEGYIKLSKKYGIDFNYVLNAPTTANYEFTESGKEKINNILDRLSELELESVTVGNPYLIKYIKENFKRIRIKASANLAIDSVEKARKVKKMGVDILVLDPLLINRDFETLKKIKNEIGGELELIVNNNCLMDCPYLPYHSNYLGLLSIVDNQTNDFCYLNCSSCRLSDSVNYLKSDIIRPEDLYYYEEIGYERFKIIDRCSPTEYLIKRIKAYSERKYDGNLLDLIQHFGYKDSIKPNQYIENIYINNKALDGFLDYFASGHCDGRNCIKSCKHCSNYAAQAITVNKEFISEALLIKKNEAIDMTKR